MKKKRLLKMMTMKAMKRVISQARLKVIKAVFGIRVTQNIAMLIQMMRKKLL